MAAESASSGRKVAFKIGTDLCTRKDTASDAGTENGRQSWTAEGDLGLDVTAQYGQKDIAVLLKHRAAKVDAGMGFAGGVE